MRRLVWLVREAWALVRRRKSMSREEYEAAQLELWERYAKEEQ